MKKANAEIAELLLELQSMDSMWRTYGSELCAGEMSKRLYVIHSRLKELGYQEPPLK
jgi:hypothetical protein